MWEILIYGISFLVVFGFWKYFRNETREEDRKKRNERLMTRIIEGRKP